MIETVIYLDHHAAAPPTAAALAAMKAARTGGWANPSSAHAAGRRARALLEGAREAVAAALGSAPADVVLTGGGTEAVALGVLGLGERVDRVVTTAIEHPAVARSVERLEAAGVTVTWLPVPHGGAPELPAGELGPGTLVATQWVNHETGTVLPVGRWAAACRGAGALLFVDATQGFGKLGLDVRALGATAVAVASHKMGGPAGAGALWVERGVDLSPPIAGGEQERGRRPGSPDVVSLAGFGAACEELPARLGAMEAVAARRDRLERALVELGAVVNGAQGPRVATVTNASVEGWRGEHLVAAADLEGLCIASGAACSSGLNEPSPVVAAMYPGEPWRAEGAIRASLGPDTTDEDIEGAAAILARVIRRRAAG